MNSKVKTIIDKSEYDALCLLPCPIKVPVETGFEELIHKIGSNCSFTYLVEGNANYEVMWMDESSHVPRKEELPKVIISSGVNSFYRRDFREKAIQEKYFKKVPGADEFVNSELGDLQGNYYIMSLNCLVMVVDLTKLNGRPVPQSFAQLLDGNFEKEVAIRGKKSKYCETTLFSIYKDFGMEGIKKLSKLVGFGGHPAEMVKKMISGVKESPTISIVPYFYAKLMKNNKKIKIIWPEEGAIVSPVTLLVQSEADHSLDNVVNYFVSEQVRKICKDAYLPHPLEYFEFLKENNYKLNWIGWDFIEKHEVNQLLIELNQCFK
ncbi:ABC transporter substrate-binding protein [Anaeromicropila populeti]|uniref:ABC-type Fe3+ transport system, substrate-binding protein n=1 Tax=Anaeromicropila populeti TaxID=37658 RepID=A0A1I6IMD0_9FIRM|nr:ABC transporter substrate-binding protein [Anaeromicropila populeti]SFR67821.1 ABC-type Fe3+ transport system, substrate-binding protein [Anaeromicropila populeti]